METVSSVVTHNVAPMYADPDDNSELVSQAIMLDALEVLDREADFARVKTCDGYSGWMRRSHFAATDDPALAPERIRTGFVDVRAEPDGRLLTKLVLGTGVRRCGNPSGGWAPIDLPAAGRDTEVISYRRAWVPAAALEPQRTRPLFHGENACRLALQFVGTPYLWGGTTPFGFDCSGLMQRLYGMAGVVIPRDAYLQSTSPLGRAVDPQTPPAAGDLVFFLGPTDRRGRGITHVGMALDPVRFVHGFSRAGVVETDFLDEDYMAEYTNKGAWRINQEAE